MNSARKLEKPFFPPVEKRGGFVSALMKGQGVTGMQKIMSYLW